MSVGRAYVRAMTRRKELRRQLLTTPNSSHITHKKPSVTRVIPRSMAAIHVSSATTAVASSQGQIKVCVSDCTYLCTAKQSFPETALHATSRTSNSILDPTTQEVAQFAIRSKRHRHNMYLHHDHSMLHTPYSSAHDSISDHVHQSFDRPRLGRPPQHL
jgi:hypothetical protein